MKTNILITAVGGRSVGAGVLHSLTRVSQEVSNRWNIIVADADTFSWGLYQGHKAYKVPFANDPKYISKIQEIVSKEKIAAIIPGSEPEVDVLLKNQDEFAVPIIGNSMELIPLMMDKTLTHQKLNELGFNFIPTYSLDELDQIKRHPFPWIIKPTTGTGGSKGVEIIANYQEFEGWKEKNTNSNFCIQPYIGSGDSEFTVGVLSQKDGKIVDSIVMKRELKGLSLKDSKVVNGKSVSISTGYSQGYIVEAPQITEYCEDLAFKLKSTGPLNIQLRKEGDEIYVFEIHPRFSGTTCMRADVGFNEVDLLLRNHLFEEEFGRINYKKNVAVMRAFEHTITPIDQLIE